MQMTTVHKVQFGQLNDKHFYFSNDITSLPFGHLSLEEVRKKKKNFVTFTKLFKTKSTSF